MSDRTTFRPGTVTVDEDALRQLRSRAEAVAVNRRRLYGLALEFAVAEESAFEAFVREHRDETR